MTLELKAGPYIREHRRIRRVAIGVGKPGILIALGVLAFGLLFWVAVQKLLGAF